MFDIENKAKKQLVNCANSVDLDEEVKLFFIFMSELGSRHHGRLVRRPLVVVLNVDITVYTHSWLLPCYLAVLCSRKLVENLLILLVSWLGSCLQTDKSFQKWQLLTITFRSCCSVVMTREACFYPICKLFNFPDTLDRKHTYIMSVQCSLSFTTTLRFLKFWRQWQVVVKYMLISMLI